MHSLDNATASPWYSRQLTVHVTRSSSAAATSAFAAATSAANPKDHPKGIMRYHSAGPAEHGKPGSNQNLNRERESVFSTAASMRVLNVLRHWVSKHFQVFIRLSLCF